MIWFEMVDALMYAVLAAVALFFLVGFPGWLRYCLRLDRSGRRLTRAQRAWQEGEGEGPPPNSFDYY